MSRSPFVSDASHSLKPDAPTSSGRQPRWRRKAASASTSTVGGLGMPARPGARSSRSRSSINSSIISSSSMMAVSPMKGTCRTNTAPGRTRVSKCRKMPGAKGTSPPGRARRTPHGELGDRFIPVRNSENMEVARYLVSREETASPLKARRHTKKQAAMMHLLSVVDVEKARILRYQGRVPEGCSGSTQQALCSMPGYTPLSLLKKKRRVPTQPARVMDAPGVRNDFYLNALDWSVDNVVCMALGRLGTFLWDAATGTVTQHMEACNEMEGRYYPSSVSWVPTSGNFLAIGTSFNTVQIWDVERRKRLRSLSGHVGRVSSLSWNGHLLASGSRSGEIRQDDVRVARHHVASLSGHAREVCGLAWSPGGRLLASGGDDNRLLVWASGSTSPAPLHSLKEHTAAVKALAWCPWQASLLASGGGRNDHHIRLWNVNTGVCSKAVDVESQ
ncbi:cell division cycle protein 20 homolog, partial [Lethenteron reissneri]|uniref:cell division cycle protein 20 homolog n=1 Tax=Lethenteron reissneri TaxID=7753 RepID=UPI002AB64C3D